MALIAGGGFDEAIIANCAHLKLFYWVLTDTRLVGSVYSFEFLPFAVGEDRGGGAILGVLGH
jgi:hypothetical protein